MAIERDALHALKQFIEKVGTQKAAAASLGYSQAYISDILHNRRGFNDDILAKLGLRRTTVKA